MNKVTNIEAIRAGLQKQQLAVLQLADITEEEYNAFQFEIGIKLLEAHLIDPEMVKEVSYSKEYWNYFRLQWLYWEKIAIKIVQARFDNIPFDEYQSRMEQIIHSRRMWLSLRQFFTLFKIK